MAREFTEAEVDFEGLTKDLTRLVPPKVTLEDIVERLRETMLEQKARGVTLKQMQEVLKARGINIGERKLRSLLEKGELGPGRKPAGLSTASSVQSEAGDEF